MRVPAMMNGETSREGRAAAIRTSLALAACVRTLKDFAIIGAL